MRKTVTKSVRPGALGRPANSGSFSADNPKPGPGRGKKKAMQEVGAQMVADLERAYSTPELPDDPPGIKAARKMAHEDYPKFFAMWLKAKELAQGDKSEVAAAATPEPEQEVGAGEKEERLEELAVKLLDEWEAEDGNGRQRSEVAAGANSESS